MAWGRGSRRISSFGSKVAKAAVAVPSTSALDEKTSIVVPHRFECIAKSARRKKTQKREGNRHRKGTMRSSL
eukprot:9812595-Prorocentrum_lima.AAC.1